MLFINTFENKYIYSIIMKIGVCIRARDEQKIISTWVKYYIQLGFDKIVI